MSYYNVDYNTSTYDYSYAYGSSQGEYPPTYAANYPPHRIPKGEYPDAYGRTAADFDSHSDTSRAGPSAFVGLANSTTDNVGKGPSMTLRGVPGSSTRGSSEGEEPTPDIGVFDYSTNGVPDREYPFARRDQADGYYTSASSSVGISTVGGLANVTANETQFGGPLMLTEGSFFRPVHMSDAPGFNERDTGYAPFNPHRKDSRGLISPAEEVSSSSSESVYSALSDNLNLVQRETPTASFHAQDRHNTGFTEQTVSMGFLSSVEAKFSKEPASISAPITWFKSAENPSYASTEFGKQTTASTGTPHFNSSGPADTSTADCSINLQSTMLLPGINGNPRPDTSLDSCRNLQSVNHNNYQEAEYVPGPRLSHGATAFIPDAIHARATAATYATTPTNRASSSSGPSRSHVESIDRDPAGKWRTTSTSREMKGKDKIKQSGSHLRQKPYNVGRSAPTSSYECSHGCKTRCRSKKELERHEFRHKRPDTYGWFCPGLGFPWAEHGSKTCSCPTLGYTRSDDLVRHLRGRGPGNPCYETALALNWHPDIRGSIKNLPERYRPT
ncbi:hypothetical protein ACEPAH_7886 [Sanghuangporus vaninii]